MGDDVARALGVPVLYVRFTVIIAATLTSAFIARALAQGANSISGRASYRARFLPSNSSSATIVAAGLKRLRYLDDQLLPRSRAGGFSRLVLLQGGDILRGGPPETTISQETIFQLYSVDIGALSRQGLSRGNFGEKGLACCGEAGPLTVSKL